MPVDRAVGLRSETTISTRAGSSGAPSGAAGAGRGRRELSVHHAVEEVVEAHADDLGGSGTKALVSRW